MSERKSVRLEFDQDQRKMIKDLNKALGHDSLEETFLIAFRLLQAAISITTKENPEVTLYSKSTNPGSSTGNIKCSHCGSLVESVSPLDPRIQEIAVRLS
jgi:hypothetical protein